MPSIKRRARHLGTPRSFSNLEFTDKKKQGKRLGSQPGYGNRSSRKATIKYHDKVKKGLFARKPY